MNQVKINLNKYSIIFSQVYDGLNADKISVCIIDDSDIMDESTLTSEEEISLIGFLNHNRAGEGGPA